MPAAVATTVALQLLFAATMIVIPVAVLRTGHRAQAAAETEIVRQGHAPEVLAAHGIRLKEKVWEFLFAIGIAALLIGLAIANLAGASRLPSLIVEPILLVVAGFVTAGQVFAVRYTRAAFRRSDDPAVRAIDAVALMRAASSEFPSWLRPLVLIRFVLATLGTLAAIVLLLTPAASAWFR
ncbi:hypothetical protein [Nocardia wallacei]|uniref:hypothetical protein n=1 Tax=Nocardia wallacei TaxID=480035 RepID=UPI00245676A6|nr:hypothetical protein [Nocardia wallacei]